MKVSFFLVLHLPFPALAIRGVSNKEDAPHVALPSSFQTRGSQVAGLRGGINYPVIASKPRHLEDTGVAGVSDSKSNEYDPMEFFREGIDPNVFEWVNKEEVQAGMTTCGFLKPDLGWTSKGPKSKSGKGNYPEDVIYPKIKVYICMTFAVNQPAPLGNLVVHCGGPGSLSSCGMGDSSVIGTYNAENYNVITIDQRGMGRSEPSFTQEPCAFNIPNVDPSNAASIKEFLKPFKERVESCWTCQDCGFELEQVQKDGETKTFHFLHYAGTRQLAEDIERFRMAIKSKHLSLYGISYGTTVMATYATIFPRNVDKFVIDSNATPSSQLMERAYEKAVGLDFRMNYIEYACGMGKAFNPNDPKVCLVEDMRQCVQDIQQLALPSPTDDYIYNYLLQNMDRADEICALAAEQETEMIQEIIGEVTVVQNIPCPGLDTDCSAWSQPTLDFCVCGNPNYLAWSVSIDAFFVNAMDYAAETENYDENAFIKLVQEFNEKYDGLGSQSPGQLFALLLAGSYYWPNSVPLPPRGNPELEGIISGQLYDSLSPYQWTSEMRNGFKSMTLLTSQSYSHGLIDTGDGGKCQANIQHYLKTGTIGFIDGEICSFPEWDDI